MLLIFENFGHAQRGVSGGASLLPLMKGFNKTIAAIFRIQAKLPRGFPCSPNNSY